MPQDLNKMTLLQDEFLKLPQNIREWIASSEVGDIIEDINENAGIYSIARRIVIPTIVFRLVVQDLKPSAVIESLVSELRVKREVAGHLAEEIADRIFLPIEQSLIELGVDLSGLTRGLGPVGVTSQAPPTFRADGSQIPLAILPEISPQIEEPIEPVRPSQNIPGATFLKPREEKKEITSQAALVRASATMPAIAVPRSSEIKPEAPVPPSAAPFMLHQEEEFESVNTQKSFHSNVEAGYPQKVRAPSVPVKIEIGGSEFSRPNLNAVQSRAVSGSPPPSFTKQSFGGQAQKANEAFRKPALPTLPPTLVQKPDPKVQGNTLDLRGN